MSSSNTMWHLHKLLQHGLAPRHVGHRRREPLCAVAARVVTQLEVRGGRGARLLEERLQLNDVRMVQPRQQLHLLFQLLERGGGAQWVLLEHTVLHAAVLEHILGPAQCSNGR